MQPLRINEFVDHSPSLLEGQVQGKSNDLWLVLTAQGLFKVNKAFSCLIEPVPGDKVLLQLADQGKGYLLSILERKNPAPTEVHLQQDTKFYFHGKDCHWTGINELKLQTLKTKAFSSDTQFTSHRLTTQGQQATHTWSRVHCLIGDFFHTGKHYFQKLVQSVRQIKGVDKKDTEQTLHQARKSLTLHSQQASITAKKDMRIDAKRIHMG